MPWPLVINTDAGREIGRALTQAFAREGHGPLQVARHAAAVEGIRGVTAMLATVFLLAAPVRAQEALVSFKFLAPDVALDLARAALADCRQRGYQVAVAVVDRFGVTQVMLRDRFAGPHTPETAIGKAWTAVSFRTNTTDLVGATQPGMPQTGVRGLPRAVVLGGGVMVEAGGSLVGAVGVSGAPGGDADDACAKAGIEAIRDKLDF